VRLPRVRFTVRRLMVAVAVVGITLGALAACRSRSARFREIRDRHRAAMIVGFEAPGEAAPAARLDWHRAIERKYEYAARHPWLPVAPDPPEPE
jgi:hypothetical protein